MCSRWPCPRTGTRSWAGECSSLLPGRVGSVLSVHLQSSDVGFYSVSEPTTAACTSLTWSRTNAR